MKVDAYTKIVLTVIALGIGFLVLDRNPVGEAQADSMRSGGKGTVLLQDKESDSYVWHAYGDKIRQCLAPAQHTPYGSMPSGKCTAWF